MDNNITPEMLDEALKEGRFEDLSRMTGLPAEVVSGQRKMTRKERREWYHNNRKRLKLPSWSHLDDLRGEDEPTVDSTALFSGTHRFVGPWYKRLWSWITSPLVRWGFIRAKLSEDNLEKQ